MGSRLDLHEELCTLLGSRNVYYQPPETVKMHYPAIVYSRNNLDNTFADNDIYMQDKRYEITVIDKNPDSEIVERMSRFHNPIFARHFCNDNLNHDTFYIYY